MRQVCGICGQEWERSGGHVCVAHVESAVVCGEHGPQKFAECPECCEKLETQVVALQAENEKWRRLINKRRLGILKVDNDGGIDLDALPAEEPEA